MQSSQSRAQPAEWEGACTAHQEVVRHHPVRNITQHSRVDLKPLSVCVCVCVWQYQKVDLAPQSCAARSYGLKSRGASHTASRKPAVR